MNMNMQCRKRLQWQCYNTFHRLSIINPFVPALGAVLALHFSTHVNDSRFIQSWGTTHYHWGNNDHQSSYKSHLSIYLSLPRFARIYGWKNYMYIYINKQCAWIVDKRGRALLSAQDVQPNIQFFMI